MTAGSLIKKIKGPVKRTLKRLARKSRAFDSFYGSAVRRKREKRFSRYEGLPVDDSLILFESFNGRRYADSPKAIYEYMLQSDDFRDRRFVWALRGAARTESMTPINDPRTQVVPWGSDEYYKAYAEAGCWFANTRIPEAIRKKKGQTYVQCWHGTPLKRLGLDIKAGSAEEAETTRRVIHNDVSRYDCLLSPSRYFTDCITSAFGLDESGLTGVIRETGYPRNDSIVDHTAEDAAAVRESLGIDTDARVILYAPTYREDDRKNRYEYHEPLDFDRLLGKLPGNSVILFRVHYFISRDFDFSRFGGRIIDVSAYPEINDLYIISDMLITDYSSVLFDFGILGRPMIYHMHDLEHYRDELRGLYLDPEELPGRVTRTQEELEEAIATADGWAHSEEQEKKRREFRDRFTYLEDGRASERAAAFALPCHSEERSDEES